MSTDPIVANSADIEQPSRTVTRDMAGRRGAPGPQDWSTETILRTTTALGLIAIALVHFLDLFSKLRETPYLGVGYIALIAGCLTVATQLVTRPHRSAWRTAGTLAAAAFLAYAISRSIGLPQATGDVGNWEEPLGLASLFVEALVVLLSAFALTYLPQHLHVAPATERDHL
jgi:uncharacterized membrane protein HdeD (DUF308 family)